MAVDGSKAAAEAEAPSSALDVLQLPPQDQPWGAPPSASGEPPIRARTLAGAVAAGRRPTKPLDGWPWRMPLPLQGPYEQILAERDEIRRPRPLRASLPSYSHMWAEEEEEEVVDADEEGEAEPREAELHEAAAGTSAARAMRGGVAQAKGSCRLLLSASGRTAGVRCDPATGRLRFKPPVPRCVGEHTSSTSATATPAGAPTHRGDAHGQSQFQSPAAAPGATLSVRIARRPAAHMRLESPIPGPWRSSRPSSGASRPCSSPRTRPSSGATRTHSRPTSARMGAMGPPADGTGPPGAATVAATARPASARVAAPGSASLVLGAEGTAGACTADSKVAELHWAEAAAAEMSGGPEGTS